MNVTPAPPASDRLRRPWHEPLLAALAHSALMLLAIPPVSLWGVSLIAVLPLAWSAGRATSRPWRDAALTILGVLPMWAVMQTWTFVVAPLGFLPFILILASTSAGLFILTAGLLRRRLPWLPMVVITPIVWTAVEFFRGELFFNGYGWGFISHPLIDAPLLAAPARWLGVYFITFLAAAVAAIVLDLAVPRPRPTRWVAAVAAIPLIAWTLAALFPDPPSSPSADRVRVAALQTNIPESNKTAWTVEQQLEDWKVFELDTVTAAGFKDPSRPRPDIIVWPETMMPGPTLDPDALTILAQEGIVYPRSAIEGPKSIAATAFADRLLDMQAQLDIPMLVGEEGVDGFRIVKAPDGGIDIEKDARFNSVYLLQSGRITRERYDKMRLTPFGETMPYISEWNWLERQLLSFAARGMLFDLGSGSAYHVFAAPAASLGRDVRYVTPICFEVTVASHCRKLVFDPSGARRADVIANVTNDGWFQMSDLARAQHLQIARWRSLELATPMVRAANTGLCALVDHRGRLLASGIESAPGQPRIHGFLTGELALHPGATLYARLGDALAWSTLLATLALLGLAFIRRPRPIAPAPAATRTPA